MVTKGSLVLEFKVLGALSELRAKGGTWLLACMCCSFNLLSENSGTRQEPEGPQAVILCLQGYFGHHFCMTSIPLVGVEERAELLQPP